MQINLQSVTVTQSKSLKKSLKRNIFRIFLIIFLLKLNNFFSQNS